jgi:hypothetical protein
MLVLYRCLDPVHDLTRINRPYYASKPSEKFRDFLMDKLKFGRLEPVVTE